MSKLLPSQMERACDACGQLYVARKVQLAKGIGKTCSRRCGRVVGTLKLRATPRSTADKFWARVDQSAGLDACWPFTGSKDDCGYGRLMYQRRVYKASRLALILAGGNEQTNMHACHHCDNPPCCNPKHLYWGTRSENMKDAWRRGRQPAKRYSTGPLCRKGLHPMDGNNLRWSPDGRTRRCLACTKVGWKVATERAAARRIALRHIGALACARALGAIVEDKTNG